MSQIVFLFLIITHVFVIARAVCKVLGVLILVDEVEHKGSAVWISVLLQLHGVVLQLVVDFARYTSKDAIDEFDDLVWNWLGETVKVCDCLELVIKVENGVVIIVQQDYVLVIVSILLDKAGQSVEMPHVR
jgi:uncharacterized membrane protein